MMHGPINVRWTCPVKITDVFLQMSTLYIIFLFHTLHWDNLPVVVVVDDDDVIVCTYNKNCQYVNNTTEESAESTTETLCASNNTSGK